MRPTPAPWFAGQVIDKITTHDIVAYARALQFDATKPGADEEIVRAPDGSTVRLELTPEVGAARLSESDVADGRIIGQVWSSAAYAPLGFAAGTNYLWVEGTGDQARAVVIPAEASSSRAIRPLLSRHHPFKLMAPTGRFIMVSTSSKNIPLVNFRCSDICCDIMSNFGEEDLPAIDAALLESHRRLDALANQ